MDRLSPKQFRRSAWLGILLLGGLWQAQGQTVTIPEVHGTVLTGEKVDLPDALKGKVGVLIVGFSQASREQVTAWGRRLAGDYRGSNAVLYFEMPVVESVPKLLRGWVMKKMGESVPDRAKGTFLPLVDHEKEWKAAVRYTQADDAYVLVVDGAGIVRARAEGTASDESYAAVKRTVEGLK
jgi:hypothetical protein